MGGGVGSLHHNYKTIDNYYCTLSHSCHSYMNFFFLKITNSEESA